MKDLSKTGFNVSVSHCTDSKGYPIKWYHIFIMYVIFNYISIYITINQNNNQNLNSNKFRICFAIIFIFIIIGTIIERNKDFNIFGIYINNTIVYIIVNSNIHIYNQDYYQTQ